VGRRRRRKRKRERRERTLRSKNSLLVVMFKGIHCIFGVL
jgi:hypothetical protein